MSNEKFAEMCDGASKMLKALAEQCGTPGAAGELKFNLTNAPEITAALASIIVAVAESAC